MMRIVNLVEQTRSWLKKLFSFDNFLHSIKVGTLDFALGQTNFDWDPMDFNGSKRRPSSKGGVRGVNPRCRDKKSVENCDALFNMVHYSGRTHI